MEKELKNQLFLMEKEINDLREQLELLETEEKLLRETLTVAGNEFEQIVKLLKLPLSMAFYSVIDLYGEISNL